MDTATLADYVGTTEAPTINEPLSATVEYAEKPTRSTVAKKKPKLNNFREAVAAAIYVERNKKDSCKNFMVITSLPSSSFLEKITVWKIFLMVIRHTS